jgi:hypothetical protein
MIRSMYASGSSPVAAASCRTSSFERLAAPLGRPAPARFPPCPFIVPIVIENRGYHVFRHSVHLYHNTVRQRYAERGRGTESLIERPENRRPT